MICIYTSVSDLPTSVLSPHHSSSTYMRFGLNLWVFLTSEAWYVFHVSVWYAIPNSYPYAMSLSDLDSKLTHMFHVLVWFAIPVHNYIHAYCSLISASFIFLCHAQTESCDFIPFLMHIFLCFLCFSSISSTRLHVCFGLLYSCVWTYIYVALPAEVHGVLPISYELWDVNSHHACYYLMLVFGMWIRPLSYSDDLSCLYYMPCNDPFNLSL